MQHIERERETPSAGRQPARGYSHGLEGVSGALRIDTPRGTLGTLLVNDGELEFVLGRSDAECSAFFEDPADVQLLWRGELNPVVAGLQRRVLLDGDRALGARIILGLRCGPDQRSETWQATQ